MKIGEIVGIEGKSLAELADIYEELLTDAYQTQFGTEDIPTSMLQWIRSTDFYAAPASSNHHESYQGGLLVHSLNVYNHMVDLTTLSIFEKVNVAEATIVALVHDWCKIGYYESYEKNVKNDSTGKWEKKSAYRINQKGIPLGHGATSLYLAMHVMRLTNEQALAIRWHMGEYNVADNEVNELQTANLKYPMVYLIQFADRLACTSY